MEENIGEQQDKEGNRRRNATRPGDEELGVANRERDSKRGAPDDKAQDGNAITKCGSIIGQILSITEI